jgi:hypothetical protein
MKTLTVLGPVTIFFFHVYRNCIGSLNKIKLYTAFTKKSHHAWSAATSFLKTGNDVLNDCFRSLQTHLWRILMSWYHSFLLYLTTRTLPEEHEFHREDYVQNDSSLIYYRFIRRTLWILVISIELPLRDSNNKKRKQKQSWTVLSGLLSLCIHVKAGRRDQQPFKDSSTRVFPNARGALCHRHPFLSHIPLRKRLK